MRPSPSILTALLALVTTLLPSLQASAGGSDASIVVQAPVSDGGLTLVVGPERALVVSDGEDVERLHLRTGERLEAVAELDSGFVAAGVRENGAGSELLMISGGRSGERRLPPVPATYGLQVRPVLLTDDGELVAAAWLEGPDPGRLRVRASDWDGTGWGPVVEVSRASRGSQTGLAGTVLRDGSAVLVWSQFDGHDDEIVFSYREGSTWSVPRRVTANNDQPDIAPAINFTSRGALLAWSRFDGSDYRLWTARFTRGSWKNVRSIGQRGSLFPEILHRGDRIYTVARSAAPRGWSVWSWSTTGDLERASFVAVSDSRRPMLLNQGTERVTLAWPQTGRVTEGRLERVP